MSLILFVALSILFSFGGGKYFMDNYGEDVAGLYSATFFFFMYGLMAIIAPMYIGHASYVVMQSGLNIMGFMAVTAGIIALGMMIKAAIQVRRTIS